MSRAETAPRTLTGRHVLAMITGFFLLIVATDAYLVFKAVSTFGGIETPDAYRRGLAYNDRLADARQQDARGWSDETTYDAEAGAIAVRLSDRSGAGVNGKAVSASLGRAATNAHDRAASLVPAGDGLYRAEVGPLADGSWIATLTVRDGGAVDAPVAYRSKVRLWITP